MSEQNQPESEAKKPWSAPELRDLGSLPDLVMGSSSWSPGGSSLSPPSSDDFF